MRVKCDWFCLCVWVFVFADLCLFLQWIKHVDEQGRPYYYSADGSRSEWELPKVRLPYEN